MSSTKRLPSEQERLFRLIKRGVLLLVLGLIYALVADRVGGIPCVFRLITGLKCPGCGVTHMALHLLHGRVADAFRDNPAVFCMLPLGAYLAAVCSARYVRIGSLRLSRREDFLVFGMIAVLLAFGVLRNVAGVWA